MRRVISSGWTLVFKFFVSGSLILFSIVALIGLIVLPSSNALIGTAMMMGATMFFCWWGARLKQVSMDRENLYVAGVIKEICIPFAAIHSVSDMQTGWPVIVRLKEKSEFGRTILFLAKWNPLLFGGPHPILQELRVLIKEKRNAEMSRGR